MGRKKKSYKKAKRLRKQFISTFKKTMLKMVPSKSKIKDIYSKYGKKGVMTKLGDPTEDFEKVFQTTKKAVERIYKTGSEQVYSDDGEALDMFAVVDEAAIRDALKRQYQNIQNLRRDQHKKLRKLIIKHHKEGTSIPKTTKKIHKQISGMTKARAERIARTEVIRNHATGMYATLLKNGIEYFKWLSSLNPNACKICKHLHNKVFEVGGRPYEEFIDKDNISMTLAKIKNRNKVPLPALSTHPSCTCSICAEITGKVFKKQKIEHKEKNIEIDNDNELEIIMKEYDKIYDDWQTDYNSAQYQAFKRYTHSQYININDSLRGDKEPSSDTKELIRQISDKLDDAPPAPKKTILWRGMKNHWCSDLWHSLQIGDIWSDSAFLSTSLSNKTTESFLYPGPEGYVYIAKIIVKKGQKVGGPLNRLGGLGMEAEFLLKDNLPLKLINKIEQPYQKAYTAKNMARIFIFTPAV